MFSIENTNKIHVKRNRVSKMYPRVQRIQYSNYFVFKLNEEITLNSIILCVIIANIIKLPDGVGDDIMSRDFN